MSGASSSAEASSAPRAVDCRVQPLASAAQLAQLVPAWERLAAQALEPNPFYEHWMLLPALEAYGKDAGGADFICLAVWQGNELGALFPLRRERGYRGLPVRALRSWRHRHSLLCTPLVRAGAAAECLRALLGWLRAQGGSRLLELEYLPAGGPFHAALLDALNEAGLAALPTEGYSRPLLRRQSDAGSFMQESLSAPLRRKLVQSERRLGDLGTVTHSLLAPHGDIERWTAEFLRLEAGGWKGRQGGALACREADRIFAGRIFAEAFRRGRFVGLGIDLDGQPIARLCGFAAGDGSYLFKSAYDEARARFSPGMLVQLDWIRHVHAGSALRWTDSYTGPGNQAMKRLWKDSRAIQSVVIGAGWGEFVVCALPMLKCFKNFLNGKKRGHGR
jgi:CelD/BcsL family acetyltransferase involved in cellulose biosynthesis